MDVLELASHLWPMWMLGLFMILATIYAGHKDILSIDKPTVIKWIKFLCVISVFRALMLYLMWDTMKENVSAVAWIPWQTTMMVWWEDAAHTLPLLLLMRLIGTEKKTWPIHAIAFLPIWLSFLCGHLYQGLGNAFLVSLYIPFSLNIAKDKGLGTLMINHILFDLFTLSLIQTMLRYMHA